MVVFVVGCLAAVVGFTTGFLFGMDHAGKRLGSRIRASEATSHECRTMALNLAEIIRQKDLQLKGFRKDASGVSQKSH